MTRGATYLAMEGPQFSTRAESRLYGQWGCDVIGMTASPEYKLAREAELPYALIGMVTDYDCWREERRAVEVAEVIAQLQANAGAARRLVVELAQRLPPSAPSPIDTNLDAALITAAQARDPVPLASARPGRSSSAVEPRQPLGRHAEPIESNRRGCGPNAGSVAPPARAAGEGVLAERRRRRPMRGQSRHPP